MIRGITLCPCLLLLLLVVSPQTFPQGAPMYPRQTIPQAKIPGTVQTLLDSEFVLPGLQAGKTYGRIHVLEEGGGLSELQVTILEHRDVCISISGLDGEPSPVLRFCSYEGGGVALRTRNALLLLAEAIRLDNLEHPTR